MTPGTDERPQMSVEEFEELARRAPETVSLEFLDGRVYVKHGPIDIEVMQRPELALYPEQGLRIDTYRKGCIKPDGALAPVGYFAGQEEWASPVGVLLAVEVTSRDRDTERRDRQEKPRAYAYAGIPVYLLIDRDNHTVVVYSSPENGVYQSRRSFHYGSTVRIPAPVAITLETEALKDYAD
ncbi:Uma2 family endonuclease [Streptomyces sp. NPDC088360]|uniref:Uma2 family endonuclease n=1 Tax=Streptomyces sp. NPDC088360 TaxID=3154515 RepID=UPI00344BB3A7